VCDREKLIRSLLANPERLRTWAETLEVEPTREAVTAYIRKLRPVNLTRDTQVTNHAYSDGKVNPYQAIMAQGTAVLVDEDGKPVVRCRCGNPLAEPVELETDARCINCPPNCEPPPPCDYKDPQGACYRPSPDPPPVEENGEPPSGDCESDPSRSECQQRCEEDPTLPYCGDQTDESQAPEGEEQQEPTDGQADPSGGAPSDGGTTPPDGGSGATVGGGSSGGGY